MARFFFENPVQRTLGQIEFDVVVEEQFTQDSDAPAYPLEDGSTITDHIQLRPRVVRVTGLVTNAPIVEDEVGGNRALDAYELLQELRNAREPIEYTSSVEVFDDMVITQLSVPRDRRNYEVLRFTAELRETETVASSSVEIPADVIGGDQTTQEQAQPEFDSGSAATDELDFELPEGVEAEIDELQGESPDEAEGLEP